jgi:hypothetical protein
MNKYFKTKYHCDLIKQSFIFKHWLKDNKFDVWIDNEEEHNQDIKKIIMFEYYMANSFSKCCIKNRNEW